MSRRIILYPLIFLAVLFAVDKIFLLPEVRTSFIQPGGMIYYAQREELITRMRKDLAQKKSGTQYVVVFGDSRSFALGHHMFAEAGINGMRVYNFAGPQALPAYHAYLAGRLFRGINRPDYLLLGISPDAFNRAAGIFGSPVLNFGVDRKFIKDFASLLPEADAGIYRSSRRYALAGLGFSLKTLKDRLLGSLDQDGGEADVRNFKESNLKNPLQLAMLLNRASSPDLSHYSLNKSAQAHILRLGLGAQYAWGGAASEARLKADAQRLEKFYLRRFVPSAEQMYFLGLCMRRARVARVRTLLFRPRVSPHLFAAYKRLPVADRIWQNIQDVARKEGVRSLDMNDAGSISCNQFNDASHMSVRCFPETVRFLVRHLHSIP